MGIYFAGGTRT
ncbi:MAG: hypothetical protein EZS28_053621, partial [Streblomastix strix]